MIFDGECTFCRFWIDRWKYITGDRIEYVESQDVRIAETFPELSREQLEQSVQLIEPSGEVFSGAEAVFRALATSPGKQWPLRWYQMSPFFARFAQQSYRFVAEHRSFFSALTKLLWSKDSSI